MGKYGKLAANTALFALSGFASKLLILLLLPLYTNILSTEEYGMVDLIINLVNLLYPILTLSVSEATLRYTFKKEIEKSQIFTVTHICILGGALLLVIFTPFISLISTEVAGYWGFIIILYLGISYQTALSYYLKGNGNSKIFAIQGVIQTIVLLSANIFLLAVCNLGISGYLTATVLGYFFACAFMILFGKIYKECFKLEYNKSLAVEMLEYSLPMIPSTIGWWINASADKYELIWLVGISASGIYSVAHKIPSIMTTVVDFFVQAFTLSAISSYESKDKEAISFCNNTTNVVFSLCLAICSVLIGGSELFGKLLFSKDFFAGWVCVPPLLISALFSCVSSYLAAFFKSTKKTKMLFYSTGIGAVANIVLNYIFIKSFQTIGAAYATALGFAIVAIIRLYYIKDIIHLKLKYQAIIVSFILIIFEMFIIISEWEFRYMCVIAAILLVIFINRNVTMEIIRVIKTKIRGEK